jgi:hypothetical protein
MDNLDPFSMARLLLEGPFSAKKMPPDRSGTAALFDAPYTRELHRLRKRDFQSHREKESISS